MSIFFFVPQSIVIMAGLKSLSPNFNVQVTLRVIFFFTFSLEKKKKGLIFLFLCIWKFSWILDIEIGEENVETLHPIT